ncbi:MAG TPA: efflux transporter outer membrane subunit [Caulobacteraceae bacterium]|nr:efflux transporter outer membrane subunit [Caulobacteraceae bacterium]
MVGPNYRKPVVQIPTDFKEAVDWRRARPDPQAALSSTWWLAYHDDALSRLVDQALKANQSIVAAEAAWRLARATVAANKAQLYPTVTAGLSLTRFGEGSNVLFTGTGASGIGSGGGLGGSIGGSGGSIGGSGGSISAAGRSFNIYDANAAVSWEPDLWGKIRRQIESAKQSAQATDAQLAGERLSIAASVAIDYFALRQADIDIDLLQQQQHIDARLLDATRAAYRQGSASNASVLTAQDVLETVVADLQTIQTSREQDEHAIAVLVGVPPADFTLAPQSDYVFATPPAPLVLPSQLLERRPDVVAAERTAAAANAKIGVAVAAFYPTLNLSVEGGFESTAIGQLFSLPSQFWTLGPSLSETVFDGGARTAAVREARATFDQEVATYRGTVLTAFQDVENSLSSYNHLQQQARAFANIYDRNQLLFSAQHQASLVGSASVASELTQQLTLLQAEQNLKDTQSLLTQSSVTLVENLGGGWQWDDLKGAALSSAAPRPPAQAGTAAP